MAIASGIGAFLASEVGQAVFSTALSAGKSYLENRMNQKNAQDQRDWQEEMSNKQNAYNSPVMMAFRMRQAGLNPYAMTGAEPAGSAGTGATAQTSPIASPLDVISQMASIRNINADTSKKTEEAESTRLTNMKLAVEANNFDEYYRLYLDGIEKSNNLTHEQAEKTRAEALKAFEDARQLKDFGNSGGNIYQDSHNLSMAQIRNLDNASSLLEKQISRYDDMTDAQIAQLESSARSLDASAYLAYENASKASSETEALRYINQSNELKASLRDFYQIDFDSLPLHLQYAAFHNYRGFKEGNLTSKEAYNATLALLRKYREMSNTRVINNGENVKFGPLGYGWTNAQIL